ncbi:MAG TPA: aldo/keto reductase [Acidobacteriota bacterium]|nr:aldo/keto reductase [Acidobacteriota bacterium]
MSENRLTRRQFIRGAAATAGVAMASRSAVFPAQTKKTATDQVTLGNTGIRLSRLGIGTGTVSGSVQRSLGHEKFNDLIHYAYDRGITYIDTGESYQTHPWVREAIKGLPREKLYIQSKMLHMGSFAGRGGFGSEEPALERLERFRKELNVDYIDTVLIHCQMDPNWEEHSKSLMDGLEEAKQKKIIRAHGVSCHSLPALKKAAELRWVDVNLVRINPQGVDIDTAELAVYAASNESHVPAVVEQLKIMRKNGHGVIGMKLIAQGKFTNIEDRRKSLRWVMQNNLTDAVVLGMKSKEEIDEAIANINNAFL